MEVQRGVSAGLVVFLAGLLLLAGAVSPPAASAGASKLVEFVRPADDQLVVDGRVRVIVRTRSGARPTRLDVDAVDVTRRLRRGPDGTYSATLSVGRGLHYGYNDALVRTTGRDRRRSTDRVRFIVAKPNAALLKLTSFDTSTRETHVRVALRLADGATARAYVNGRRVDRALSREGRLLVGRLGANDGLRFGRNRIRILVHRTHRHRHQSSFDVESRTVTLGRDAPIASAGADRTITENSFAVLDGRATKLPAGSAGHAFSWRIVRAPKGAKAILRNASSRRPVLRAERPGRYHVRVSVRPTGTRGARRLATAAQTGQAPASNDTATVTVMPDIPTAGIRLDTLKEDGSVMLAGQPVAGTGRCCNSINYAVLDRRTLELAASGSVDANVAGMQSLGTIIDRYTGSLDHLVVFNWVGFAAGSELGAARTALDNLLLKIGGRKLTAGSQPGRIATDQYPGSAVGVAGAPAGSAFVVGGDIRRDRAPDGSEPLEPLPQLSGSLRLNGVTGKYDFVFTDHVHFDTETNQTATDISPAQLTIEIGATSYSQPNPGGGVSGFHLLILRADTLQPLFPSRVYPTNAADGAEQPDGISSLANDLRFIQSDEFSINNSVRRPLFVLQAFGAPHGKSDFWDRTAKQIELLGGTRQVFNALNATDPRALNGEDPNRKGPYAFVGRLNATAPQAEQSRSLDGRPGRLRGVLMRARDGGYEPMIAAPPGSDGRAPVNSELIDVANQDPRPFPALRDAQGAPVDAGQAQAVQNFLGGPEVTSLCSAGVPACDFRKLYYQSYTNPSWSAIQAELANARDMCSQTRPGFTPSQCEGIRVQLRDEVSKVQRVKDYFGPLGLQQPLGAAGVAALADLGEIYQEIQAALNPPAANNIVSNVLDGLSATLKVGGFAPPPYSQVAAGLSGAFAAAGYFSQVDGRPNIIGGQVTTSTSKVGVELANRYLQAGDNLDDLRRLIVGDYGKLTTVASKVDAQPGPGEVDWRLGNVGQARDALRVAGKRMIYERLVPLAFPVMYDLGQLGNAREWSCRGELQYFGVDKELFADQADSAQFIARFPGVSWTPTIAVAAANAQGNLSGARIPGVPGSIADTLFKPLAAGGVGFNKLQFYSPRNKFRYFPAEPTPPNGSTGGTLQKYPYPGEQDENDRIYCTDVPDPPGNSG